MNKDLREYNKAKEYIEKTEAIPTDCLLHAINGCKFYGASQAAYRDGRDDMEQEIIENLARILKSAKENQ